MPTLTCETFLTICLMAVSTAVSQMWWTCTLRYVLIYTVRTQYSCLQVISWHYIDRFYFFHSSLVSIVTRLWTGQLGLNSQQKQGIFLLATASRPLLGPTQPPIQWAPEAFPPGIKQPGHEAYHLPPASVKIKNAWSYTYIPPYVFMVWCLVEHRIHFHGVVLS